MPIVPRYASSAAMCWWSSANPARKSGTRRRGGEKEVRQGLATGAVAGAALREQREGDQMPGVAGLRALITDGSSGIGLAIASLFAREGITVAVLDRSPVAEDRRRTDMDQLIKTL